MSKYVFISNSTKPTKSEYDSLENIKLSNVSRPCLKAAKQLGYEVIFGINRKFPKNLKCEEMDLHFYDSFTYRNLFSIKDNYKAYRNLCEVLKQGDVEVIHCNTPIGGMVGRICGRKYKIPKVIYTAHGFHFYKGAPLFNNTILKWAEEIMAHWTDVIITMNEEDYQAAKRMKLKKGGKVYKINGVGINIEEYQNINVDLVEKRRSLGLSENDFVCIAMGDLVKRKNYETAIRVIAKCKYKNIHYLICGEGPELKQLQELSSRLQLDKRIHFLGFRNDIKELLAISDCFLFTSLQEGLPRSLMEAMASGLPCIVSSIRGNIDLLNQNSNYIFTNVSDCENKLTKMIEDQVYRTTCCELSHLEIQKYSSEVVYRQIMNIYKSVIMKRS